MTHMKRIALAISATSLLAAVPAQAQLLRALSDIVKKKSRDAAREEAERMLDEEVSGEKYQGGADVPELLQGRWGLSEAHCMQPETYAPGIVVIDSESFYFEDSRGTFGAPIAKGKTFLRAKINYLTDSGPMQRDLAFNVMDQRKMGWTEYTKYGLRTSDGYIRCRPQPAEELR